MGVVRKSAIYNSLINYLGIALGYINIVLLFPAACTTEEFGLTRLLLSMAVLHSQVSNLGINRTLVKFFPMLESSDRTHRGLLTLGFIIIFSGFILISIPYIIFKSQIIGYFASESSLFVTRYYYVLPLALFHLTNLMLESFIQALRRTVFTNFLKNFFIRILIAIELILLLKGFIDFEQFVVLFILSYFLNTLISLGYLGWIGHLKLKFDKTLYRPMLIKYMAAYSGFAALSGISSIVVNHIDKIMIGFLLGLTQTGIYAMAAYISAVIAVPAQAIGRVAFPLISAKYKRKDWAGMQDVYYKSALTQLLMGGFIFSGILININNVFELLPGDYAGGQWVILWVGLSIMSNIATGVNGQIINISKHFQFDALTSGILLVLTVITNFLFIPKFGITGAAFATFLTLFIYNLIKYIFLYVKLGLNPFSKKTILSLGILLVALLIGVYLPKISHPILDILYRSTVYSLIFFSLILFFKPSPDIDNTIKLSLKKLKILR